MCKKKKKNSPFVVYLITITTTINTIIKVISINKNTSAKRLWLVVGYRSDETNTGSSAPASHSVPADRFHHGGFTPSTKGLSVWPA